MSNKFVKDPREVVKAGDIVKVKVLEVDLQRKRVALTMRMDDPVGETKSATDARRDTRAATAKPPAQKPAPSSNAFADAFARAKRT